MTALRPTETSRVRGVASERYPTNQRCAHPDCNEPIGSVHHIFPRSLTKSDSYFVEITWGGDAPETPNRSIIPHAIGLCGSGTTGHHGDVEEHRAWIKYEGDNVLTAQYVWYERVAPTDPHDEIPADWQGWNLLGALNPQPGSVDGKPKRKRTVKGTSERAARKTVSIRLPEGTSGDDWDLLVEDAETVELQQPDSRFDKARGGIAVGSLLVSVLERFTGRAG